MLEHLVRAFPRLNSALHQVTSPAQPDYNCVAWAARDTQRWWWPDESGCYHWPDESRRRESLDAFAAVFEVIGYERCPNADLEAGWEKVAIYAHEDGSPTHASRQLADGSWTSKLGGLEDIRHEKLDQLAGIRYGQPVLFLRRCRADQPRSPEDASS